MQLLPASSSCPLSAPELDHREIELPHAEVFAERPAFVARAVVPFDILATYSFANSGSGLVVAVCLGGHLLSASGPVAYAKRALP
jgi:hypothetical protein